MKKGILAFHQGWTDIINCLPLIDFYLQYYDELKIIAKKDAKEIYDFYLRYKPNTLCLYDEPIERNFINETLVNSFPEHDRLFHGYLDSCRHDQFANVFPRTREHFVKRFYTPYNIDYINRVNCFNIDRDHDLEEQTYNNFVQNHGNDYILIHETQERPLGISITKKHINLGGLVKNFFSTIKILQNAKEIHVIDSVWGSLCYLLDCRYKILNHVPIKLYPFLAEDDSRGGGCLRTKYEKVLEPLHPENWKIAI